MDEKEWCEVFSLVSHRRVQVLKRYVGLLVIALVIAACGEGGGSNDDPSNGDSSGSSGGEETLAAFFGWDDFDESQWRDEEARRQELIRQCMAEQGFEYIPIQQPESSFSVSWDEEEYVKTQGFGISTWFGNEEEFDEAWDEWEDPNWALTEAMSESERDAYYAALHGSPEDWEEADAITVVDPETGEEWMEYEGSFYGFGCEGEASEQVWGDMDTGNELWEELGPQMEAMWERVQADPKIVELNEEWSQCMAEAGYSIPSRDDLWNWEGDGVLADIQQRFDELVGDIWADPFEGWSESEIEAFFEERTNEEIEAFWREQEEASRESVDQEALAALQQEEIDLAVANYECGKDLNEAYEEVSREYERDFIAANRSLLEQIREAQGG